MACMSGCEAWLFARYADCRQSALGRFPGSLAQRLFGPCRALDHQRRIEPRGDGYKVETQMSAAEAEAYHAMQMKVFSESMAEAYEHFQSLLLNIRQCATSDLQPGGNVPLQLPRVTIAPFTRPDQTKKQPLSHHLCGSQPCGIQSNAVSDSGALTRSP
jgi:hypothetical protein